MNFTRYDRQIRYAPLGEAGQQQLAAARVLVCGCGALGSVLVNTLARAGVGFLRIVDRDFLELNNLQRQVLYTEQDVLDQLPKAIAAANHLRAINSEITVEPHVVDITSENISQLAEDIDVIVDGTDNFEIRFLINDYAIKNNVPWVYGGCVGATGQTMTILPGETACLRCLMEELPAAGSMPTCDTTGIMSPIINVIASLEAMEVLKIVSGNQATINRKLKIIDLWKNSSREVSLDALHKANDCPTCTKKEFPWLDGLRESHTTVLCGRNSVQFTPIERTSLSFETLAVKLSLIGTVSYSKFFLRFTIDSFTLTLFPDGRAIINGTEEPAKAKSLYARYFGG